MQGASHPRAPSATLGGCRRSRHRPRHTYPGRAGRSTPDPHQALNQRRPAPVSPTHRTRGGTTRPVAPPGVGVGVTHPQAPAQNWRPSHTRPSRAGRHHLSHPPAKPAAPPVRAQRPRAPPSQPAPGGVWLGALSTPSGVTGRAQQGCAGPRRPGAPPFRPPPPRPERLSALRGVEGAPTAARSPTRGQQERIPAPRLRGPRHRPHPRGPGAWPTVNPPPPRGGTHNPRSHRGPQGGVAGGCSSHASPAVPTGRAAPRRAWAPPPPAPVPPVPAVPWPPHPPFPPFPLSPPVPLSPPPPLSSGRSLPATGLAWGGGGGGVVTPAGRGTPTPPLPGCPPSAPAGPPPGRAAAGAAPGAWPSTPRSRFNPAPAAPPAPRPEVASSPRHPRVASPLARRPTPRAPPRARPRRAPTECPIPAATGPPRRAPPAPAPPRPRPPTPPSPRGPPPRSLPGTPPPPRAPQGPPHPPCTPPSNAKRPHPRAEPGRDTARDRAAPPRLIPDACSCPPQQPVCPALRNDKPGHAAPPAPPSPPTATPSLTRQGSLRRRGTRRTPPPCCCPPAPTSPPAHRVPHATAVVPGPPPCGHRSALVAGTRDPPAPPPGRPPAWPPGPLLEDPPALGTPPVRRALLSLLPEGASRPRQLRPGVPPTLPRRSLPVPRFHGPPPRPPPPPSGGAAPSPAPSPAPARASPRRPVPPPVAPT
uniref:Basic proline-rich protein-like n=1 Tax=Knipowitschia caucasica TaxID=637954 RepID=A0AAV2MP96_KNICA